MESAGRHGDGTGSSDQGVIIVTSSKTPVSVIGLGRLGAALAEAFLAAGHPTTVWNRSPGKSEHLAAQGATVAGSLTKAIEASPLVLTVLAHHGAVRELLDPVVGSLSGRTLLNISSSTPEDIRKLATWAQGHGADYLDGAVMAVPQAIGTADAQVLYSGSPAAFDSYGEQLGVLGAARYVGEDPGVAELYSYALLSAGYGTLFGFLHGTAMLDSAGVRPTEFLALAVPWLNGMVAFLSEIARETETGDYSTGESSLDINLFALENIVAASRTAGVDPGFHVPTVDLVRKRIAAGNGQESASGVFEVMRTGG
ncbi:NAD(P)-dependent oxidoreductase [Crossiella sp. S99.2]|uniref:NAD(P)-dependent oxidoreductase n=1 Tax=Crossiella sp. S99.2 TaxID=2936272 RepID=UPI0035ABCF83